MRQLFISCNCKDTACHSCSHHCHFHYGALPHNSLWWFSTLCFYPRPSFAFGYHICLHLSVCVNYEPVSTMTCQPFKQESPNLDQKFKPPLIKSQPFGGGLILTCKAKFDLKSKFNIFRIRPYDKSPSIQVSISKLGPKCILALRWFFLIDLDLHFYFLF